MVLIEDLQPTAQVCLSHTVAVAHAFGPRRGLALLDQCDRAHRMTDDPLSPNASTRSPHLLDQLDDHDRADGEFRAAAGITENEAERRFLLHRAHRPARGISPPPAGSGGVAR